MTLRRAMIIAALMLPAVPAAAQFPQAQQAPQAQKPPPCIVEFMKLRDDTEQKAKAIQATQKRQVSPQEVCKLFTQFTAAEAKMIKYATDNSVWCGIPEEAVKNMKKGHAKASEVRTRVCRAAAAPPRPTGPSLSDALTAPVTDSGNIKTGRGTFDTLTGTPLGPK